MRHIRFVAAALFSLACLPAPAQVVAGLGAISGVVRDASGASVPNAGVVISNPARGIERKLHTNEAGVFTAPALPPAAGYQVAIEAPSFAPFEARDLQINVGQNLNLNVELQIAGANTQVNVVDAAPLVNDTQTELSQVVNERQIDHLPINGRRVDSFVLLTPATTSDGTFGQISFRGVPGNNNTFLTDGNDTTNQYYGENAGRTRILSQISQDAVQEFQVLNAGYSAEYGRAAGGIVNTVTHGAATMCTGRHTGSSATEHSTRGTVMPRSTRLSGGTRWAEASEVQS